MNLVSDWLAQIVSTKNEMPAKIQTTGLTGTL